LISKDKTGNELNNTIKKIEINNKRRNIDHDIGSDAKKLAKQKSIKEKSEKAVAPIINNITQAPSGSNDITLANSDIPRNDLDLIGVFF